MRGKSSRPPTSRSSRASSAYRTTSRVRLIGATLALLRGIWQSLRPRSQCKILIRERTRRAVLRIRPDPDRAFPTLVGRLPWALAFGCSLWSVSTERSLCAGSRAAEPVAQRATGASPPLAAFAVPHKRRRLFIPASCRLLKPAPDLLRAVRVLSIQRAALEHALDRLRHVEPAAADGRVERHDAMRAQPQHQVGRLVAGKIVPHQQKPQGRQILRL